MIDIWLQVSKVRLHAMLAWFGDVARSVAKRLGFVYDAAEEEAIERYLRWVKGEGEHLPILD